MKKSEFKNKIKEEIISILREEEGKVNVKKGTLPSDIKKLTDTGLEVNIDDEI
jgi:hypothetical protein